MNNPVASTQIEWERQTLDKIAGASRKLGETCERIGRYRRERKRLRRKIAKHESSTQPGREKLASAKRKLVDIHERIAQYKRKREKLKRKISKLQSRLRRTVQPNFRLGTEQIIVRVAAEIRFDGIGNRSLKQILAANLDREDQAYGAEDSKIWSTSTTTSIMHPATIDDDHRSIRLLEGDDNLSKACISAIAHAAEQEDLVPPWPVLDGPMPGVIAALEQLEFLVERRNKHPAEMDLRIDTATTHLQDAIDDILRRIEPITATREMIAAQSMKTIEAEAELIAARAHEHTLCYAHMAARREKPIRPKP